MSLSRNDMLSTEGRAPRARRSCYVDEPAYGFFVAGSSIKRMNGVYVRGQTNDCTTHHKWGAACPWPNDG
eukprot:1476643-Pleurochrysis_carterae.AAC.1